MSGKRSIDRATIWLGGYGVARGLFAGLDGSATVLTWFVFAFGVVFTIETLWDWRESR